MFTPSRTESRLSAATSWGRGKPAGCSPSPRRSPRILHTRSSSSTWTARWRACLTMKVKCRCTWGRASRGKPPSRKQKSRSRYRPVILLLVKQSIWNHCRKQLFLRKTRRWTRTSRRNECRQERLPSRRSGRSSRWTSWIRLRISCPSRSAQGRASWLHSVIFYLCFCFQTL